MPMIIPPAKASGIERSPPTTAAADAMNTNRVKVSGIRLPSRGAPTTPAREQTVVPMIQARAEVARGLTPRNWAS